MNKFVSARPYADPDAASRRDRTGHQQVGIRALEKAAPEGMGTAGSWLWLTGGGK